MLRVSFDLSLFRSLAEQMGELSRSEFLRALVERLAEVALVDVRHGFDESRDPNGQSWAPLRSRAGKPLVRTGELRQSFGSRANGSEFSIGSQLSFAGFHQEGTRKMPARPMVPEGELGPEWAQTLETEIDQAMERLFGSDD
jgi:phage gpG-like protein